MLFAAYTPPSGYAPPPRKSNTLMIVLGVCGGCLLIAIIAAVALTAFVYNKTGPLIKRTITATKFVTYIKQRQYSQAETLLTPQAQQTYPVDKLTKTAEGMEKRYGPLQSYVSEFSQNPPTGQGGPDFNAIREFGFMLNYERGTGRLTLTFDQAPDQADKIANVKWSSASSEQEGSSGGKGGHGGSNKNSSDSGG